MHALQITQFVLFGIGLNALVGKRKLRKLSELFYKMDKWRICAPRYFFGIWKTYHRLMEFGEAP